MLRVQCTFYKFTGFKEKLLVFSFQSLEDRLASFINNQNPVFLCYFIA